MERCSVCGERTTINIGEYTEYRRCRCQRERDEKQEREQRVKDWKRRIQQIPCLHIYQNMDFAHDDGADTSRTNFAKGYIARWAEMRQKGRGIIFFGPTGTGKTFLASCIINALLEQGVCAAITSLPDLIDANFDSDYSSLAQTVRLCDLLVIDDFGAESDSQFRLEKTFQIVNARYTAGKPTIVTTNLSYTLMRTDNALPRRRIYQRIVSRCIPCEMQTERRDSEIKTLIKETKGWAI